MKQVLEKCSRTTSAYVSSGMITETGNIDRNEKSNVDAGASKWRGDFKEGKSKRLRQRAKNEALQIPTRYQNMVDWSSHNSVLNQLFRQKLIETPDAESPAKNRRVSNMGGVSGGHDSSRSINSSFTSAIDAVLARSGHSSTTTILLVQLGPTSLRQ